MLKCLLSEFEEIDWSTKQTCRRAVSSLRTDETNPGVTTVLIFTLKKAKLFLYYIPRRGDIWGSGGTAPRVRSIGTIWR
jgi:hypothetical protein